MKANTISPVMPLMLKTVAPSPVMENTTPALMVGKSGSKALATATTKPATADWFTVGWGGSMAMIEGVVFMSNTITVTLAAEL